VIIANERGLLMYDICNSMAYAWMTFAFLFLLLEIGSPGLFFFIGLFFGGIGAAIAALYTPFFIDQFFVFFGITTGALVLLRYIALPYLAKNRTHERTNMYALQGKHGFVIVPITSREPGMVKVQGERWIAYALHNNPLAEGDEIEVVDIRGAHLIVKKYIRSQL